MKLISIFLSIFLSACLEKDSSPLLSPTHQTEERQPNTSLSLIDKEIQAKKLIIKKYDKSNVAEHPDFLNIVKKANSEINRVHRGQGLFATFSFDIAITFGMFLEGKLIGTALFLENNLSTIAIDPDFRGKGYGKFLFIYSMAEFFANYDEVSLRNDAKELGNAIYGKFAKNFFRTELSDRNKYTYKLYDKDFYRKKLKESVPENWLSTIYQKLLSLGE